ncbi:MAG TPA: RNA methyltransferase [Terriglobales bacterium]|nr:RNA methyltransferase [Terriglobales bacterium]
MPQIPQSRLSVVLVSTRNPLNIGAAARALSNFGFTDLRLVTPYAEGFREARSAKSGSAALLQKAKVYDSVAEAVADCSLIVGTTAARDRELHHPLHRLESAAKDICKHLAVDRVALLFGSEKRGLLNADLSHCHWLLRIPTREGVSMNLGQAVAVCLYELIREKKPAAPKPATKPALASDVERFTGMLVEGLRASGYLNPDTPASEEKVRRIVRRLGLPADDAEVWLGMLRQILWKLGKS